MNNHVDHCEVCQTTEGVREICSDGAPGTPTEFGYEFHHLCPPARPVPWPLAGRQRLAERFEFVKVGDFPIGCEHKD